MIDHDAELRAIYERAENQRDYVTMVAALEQAVETSPSPATLHMRIGEICMDDLRDIQKAHEAFRLAHEIAPTAETQARLDRIAQMRG